MTLAVRVAGRPDLASEYHLVYRRKDRPAASKTAVMNL
jgi:hypothetical protein